MFVGFGGDVTLGVELSWVGGTSWTVQKTHKYTNEDPTDSTGGFGSLSDTWGRTWSPSDFSNGNFQVRIEVISFGSTAVSMRCDSVKVRVQFTAPFQKLAGSVKTPKVVLTG